MASIEAKQLFGEAVKLGRMKAGVTQRQLAQRTGVDVKTIGRIEAGIKDAMLSTAAKIANELGANLTELTPKSAQEFPKARERFLATLAVYAADCEAHPQSSERFLAAIRHGTDDETIRAWIDETVEGMAGGDDNDQMRKVCEHASGSPEIFGRVGAADLRRYEWSIVTENDNVIAAFFPDWARQNTTLTDAIRRAKSSKERTATIKSLIDTAVQASDAEEQESTQNTWERLLVYQNSPARYNANRLRHAISLADA